MTRTFLMLVLTAALVCGAELRAQTAPPADTAPQSARPSQTPVEAKRPAASARQVLKLRVDEVTFDDVTFQSVLDWVHDQARERGMEINIVAVWRALEPVGVDPDASVTLSMTSTTVGDVLAEALKVLNENGEVKYQARSNILRISSKVDFEKELVLRVYDVSDIIVRIPQNTGPEIDIQQAQQSSGGGGGGGQSQPIFTDSGQGGDEDASGDQATREQLDRLREIKEIIEVTIEPSHWQDTAGGPGTIRPFNRSLIITASIEVQEQIGGWFVK